MVKLASDYPITFPFGATSAPYSPTHPHSGEDRAMPIGTIVRAGTADIGLSGGAVGAFGSGESTGPHLHIQKMVDGTYVSPKGLGLGETIAFPATVTEVGNKSDVGNYVRLVDANGVRWSYFHLSKILVRAGLVINKSKGANMSTIVDNNLAADLAALAYFREGAAQTDPTYLKSVVGQPVEDVIRAMLKSAERKAIQDRLNAPKGITAEQQAKIDAATNLAKSIQELTK